MKADTKILEEIRDQERQTRLLLLELAKRRREIMCRLWDNGKGLTYQQIADIYGVKDRRRIEWIVKDRGTK